MLHTAKLVIIKNVKTPNNALDNLFKILFLK